MLNDALTAQKRLRFGQTVWTRKRTRGPVRMTLSGNITTDIVIVGAGVSGALIGEMLAADGYDVAILDRRDGVALGSTAASTALVQYEIDEPITLLTRRMGFANAVRAWRRSHHAVANLAARTDALGIDCARRPQRSLYVVGDRLDSEGLEREAEARRQAGFEVDFLHRGDVWETYGLRSQGAIQGFGGFDVDPVRLTKGYLAAAAESGARIFAPVEAVGVAAGPRGVEIEATSGHRISCQLVVFATGYEFPKFVPLDGHQLTSTFAYATRPQKRRLWPTQCMIWEASDPYLYMRTTEDGRAILGGGDEEFVNEEKRDALIARKVKEIAAKAARLAPGLDTAADLAWAGTFGSSINGLPTIGEIPGYQNCWAALGYGGNGITFSRIASELIRSAAAGLQDSDADLFAFRGA